MVTPVIPTSYQSNRAQLSAALIALMDAYLVSAPTVVRKSWAAMPATLTGEGPFVFVGPVNESIRHSEGLRFTEFSGSVY